jgi:hypothetical protein
VNSLVLSASHAVAVGYLKSPVVQYNVSQTVNLSPVGEVNNVQVRVLAVFTRVSLTCHCEQLTPSLAALPCHV